MLDAIKESKAPALFLRSHTAQLACMYYDIGIARECSFFASFNMICLTHSHTSLHFLMWYFVTTKRTSKTASPCFNFFCAKNTKKHRIGEDFAAQTSIFMKKLLQAVGLCWEETKNCLKILYPSQSVKYTVWRSAAVFRESVLVCVYECDMRFLKVYGSFVCLHCLHLFCLHFLSDFLVCQVFYFAVSLLCRLHAMPVFQFVCVFSVWAPNFECSLKLSVCDTEIGRTRTRWCKSSVTCMWSADLFASE